jgi:hypothetical protein
MIQRALLYLRIDIGPKQVERLGTASEPEQISLRQSSGGKSRRSSMWREFHNNPVYCCLVPRPAEAAIV